MTAELAVKAVENACLNINDPTGIILQSDLGTQYTSDIFEKYLIKNRIRHSYSRKGCPYDNAVAEATFKIIKTEFVKNQTFINLDVLKLKLADYVNWFNNCRIHSSLGFLTPVEFRKNNLKKIV